MRTDQSSDIIVKPSTAPAAGITGNGATVGATIDTLGFSSLTFVASTGVITDGTFAGAVFGGNASNMSDEVQLTGADLIGSDIAIATTDDGVCERVGVNIARVVKRYYRIKFTQAGATTGGFLSCQALLGNARFMPVSAP